MAYNYKLIAQSRSGATEIYRGEEGDFIQVSYYKSGAVEAAPVSKVPADLTIKVNDGKVWDAGSKIERPILFPAQA